MFDLTKLKDTCIHVPTDFIQNNICRERAEKLKELFEEAGLQVKQLDGVGTTYLDIF